MASRNAWQGIFPKTSGNDFCGEFSAKGIEIDASDAESFKEKVEEFLGSDEAKLEAAPDIKKRGRPKSTLRSY